MGQVANVEAAKPPVRSVLLDMAGRFGMEPAAFEATLRATVVPTNCTREQFAAFLLVAKEYRLNPILKEIYAFPSKGGIQPIVGVDGWANLINSHPAFDGMDFEDHFGDDGALVSITCKMFRKDRSHPVTATEYFEECKRATEPWKQWPRRMLRHKAMIQAARYAFGFAGIVDPDEADRIIGGGRDPVQHAVVVNPLSDDVPPKIIEAAPETAPEADGEPEPAKEATPVDILVEYDRAFIACKTAEAHAEVVEQFAARIAALSAPRKKTADSIAARHLERVTEA